MFEPDVCRKQMYYIEESTLTLEFSAPPAVIQRPDSNSAPWELCPPRYAPGQTCFLTRAPSNLVTSMHIDCTLL